jgi:hypothetical protein
VKVFWETIKGCACKIRGGWIRSVNDNPVYADVDGLPCTLDEFCGFGDRKLLSEGDG